MKKITLYLSFILVLIATHFNTHAAPFDDAEITVVQAKNNIYMLQGPGGNIGVLASKTGLLMIDDKFEPLAEKIEAAMASITDQKLKFIINTHYHGDHTGSNSVFSSHAPIFAHKNVRKRLNNNPKVKKSALPSVTYDDGINIYLDAEHIQLTHLPHGHTDSDTVVYFKQTNVLHTGDLFFEVGFPYIDLKGGGSVKGYLDNVNYMIKHFPDDVIIIPGHGKLTDKQGLKDFAKMITYSIKRVAAAKSAGKTEADVLAMGIGGGYENLSWLFITEEKWLKTLYEGL